MTLWRTFETKYCFEEFRSTVNTVIRSCTTIAYLECRPIVDRAADNLFLTACSILHYQNRKRKHSAKPIWCNELWCRKYLRYNVILSFHTILLRVQSFLIWIDITFLFLDIVHTWSSRNNNRNYVEFISLFFRNNILVVWISYLHSNQ